MPMFKPGDVVKPRSGGSRMVVKAIDRDTVSASWLDHDGHLAEATFLAIQLEAVAEEPNSFEPDFEN
ncbi:MAG: DUF2158 domain-containing protein [Pseudomonadota bacterium]